VGVPPGHKPRPNRAPHVSCDAVDVVLTPVDWAKSLVIVDPEAVEREMKGLAVGVRGDDMAGKARLGIRLYRLEDLVGVP
jgi:hypothetical protein